MSCDIADTQITTTSNGDCKNRSRIDMEICPKQQDTALNLLVKTLRFSQTCAARELLLVGTALRDIPAHCQGQDPGAAPLCPLRAPKTKNSKSKQCLTQPSHQHLHGEHSQPTTPAWENPYKEHIPCRREEGTA